MVGGSCIVMLLCTSVISAYQFCCILSLTARPKKTLFIKNLPITTTEDEVKALSPDIQEVRLEATKNTGEKKTKYVRTQNVFYLLYF